MKNYQISRKNMMNTVETFGDQTPPATIATMVNWPQYFLPFKAKVAAIETKWEFQSRDNTGFRQLATQLRDSVTSSSLEYSSMIAALADSTNNPVLFNLMNFTDSDFNEAKDSEVIIKAQLIHDTAIENLPALAPYGITAPVMTAFNTKIDDYRTAMPMARLEIAQRKTATAEIQTLLNEATALLKSLDGVVKTLRVSNPSFVKNFKNVRRIIKMPTIPIAARGEIKDNLGNVIPKVSITCERLNLKRRSSTKGRFIIKQAPEGEYIFIFTHPGMDKVVLTVIIAAGSRAEINVVMRLREQMANI